MEEEANVVGFDDIDEVNAGSGTPAVEFLVGAAAGDLIEASGAAFASLATAEVFRVPPASKMIAPDPRDAPRMDVALFAGCCFAMSAAGGLPTCPLAATTAAFR